MMTPRYGASRKSKLHAGQRRPTNLAAWLQSVPLSSLPDFLLPEQINCPSRLNTPEAHLMIAVLISAVEDLQNIRRQKGARRRVQTVERWIHETPGYKARVPFETLCEYLALDLERTRAELERMIRQRIARGWTKWDLQQPDEVAA